MEVVLAAERVNTDSGDEIKTTENTNMNETLEKIENCKIFIHVELIKSHLCPLLS